MNHAKRKYLLIWRKICYHRYDPTSKREKTETDIAHEIYVWFTEEEEIYINLPARLSNVLRIFSELTVICSHTQKLQLNLIPQTAVVADTTLPKWSQIIKYFRNRSIYDSTRIWKVSQKDLKSLLFSY